MLLIRPSRSPGASRAVCVARNSSAARPEPLARADHDAFCCCSRASGWLVRGRRERSNHGALDYLSAVHRPDIRGSIDPHSESAMGSWSFPCAATFLALVGPVALSRRSPVGIPGLALERFGPGKKASFQGTSINRAEPSGAASERFATGPSRGRRVVPQERSLRCSVRPSIPLR